MLLIIPTERNNRAKSKRDQLSASRIWNLGEGIEEEARLPVPEPGVDAAVQLHGDAPPPVSPADQQWFSEQ